MNYVVILNVKGEKGFVRFMDALRKFIKKFKKVEVNTIMSEEEYNVCMDELAYEYSKEE